MSKCTCAHVHEGERGRYYTFEVSTSREGSMDSEVVALAVLAMLLEFWH